MMQLLPRLMWLSGLGTGLPTERSLVQLLVRVHALIAGPGPWLGACEKQLSDVDQCISHTLLLLSLSLFLPPFPSL